MSYMLQKASESVIVLSYGYRLAWGSFLQRQDVSILEDNFKIHNSGLVQTSN